MQRLLIGDFVQVTAGKEKGKRGKVTRMFNDGRLLVEGLNMVIRHTAPSQANTEGGRLSKEAPIHASNVMPIDADSDKPTRVKAVVVDGVKKRVAKSGAELKQG